MSVLFAGYAWLHPPPVGAHLYCAAMSFVTEISEQERVPKKVDTPRDAEHAQQDRRE